MKILGFFGFYFLGLWFSVVWSRFENLLVRAAYPLFPGEDEGDQLACIIELLGMPPVKVLEQSKRSKQFFVDGFPRYCTMERLTDGSTVLKAGRSKRGKVRGPPGSKTWLQALKGNADPLFVDFLERCLLWDPEARLTPRDALKHEWMRKKQSNPTLPGSLSSGNTQNTAKSNANSSNNNNNPSYEHKIVDSLQKNMDVQRRYQPQTTHS